MADFAYTPNPPNITKYLAHVQDAGVPTKVTRKHLESVGFKSKNDRSLVGVLKFLGFVDDGGVPTELWKAYKSKAKAKQVLATTLRECYSDLFSTYPDAFRKDDEALHDYFASKTGLAKATVELMVRSFKLLCEKADFEATAAASPPAVQPPTKTPPMAPAVDQGQAPTVSINIELQLPATDDAKVYDNFFAAMKKHLYS